MGVWLVCGGRNFSDRAAVQETLDACVRKFGRPELVVAGGAQGADTEAMVWAVARKIRRKVYAADWAKHGKAAGMLRNAQMLRESGANLVIAFPGGEGHGAYGESCNGGGGAACALQVNIQP
jgi:hypothetical protein